METEALLLRRAVVFASAVLYWLGVLVQARRVRRQIGRSPNLQPRGPKERLLWCGWCLVVVAWITQPFLIGTSALAPWVRLVPTLLTPLSLVLGLAMTGAGYAGTLWCYAAMGNTWRIGINRQEKNTLVTQGPFRFVRHPIYLFQVVMLAGVALLLPTFLSLIIVVLHLLCVLAKAADEESYLLTIHGQEYRDYLSRTGRLLPKWIRKTSPSR